MCDARVPSGTALHTHTNHSALSVGGLFVEETLVREHLLYYAGGIWLVRHDRVWMLAKVSPAPV